ncbi:universal stress protein [Halomarina salina]|uniref:Universal stress protein n=1 Tax=Halomarina salina TaxID=1872699 RepID=A0ABD5RJS5_9EURY|nr:universal stress protein [Halomarina salina]
MFDRILFPTDGSEGADEALEYALELARTHDATLHVLFVADTNRDSVTLVGTDVVDALTAVGEESVASVVDRASEHDVPTETAVEQGTPWRTIVDYAEGNDVDLLVMATHGRRGLDRYLLGSVTEKVVRTSTIPVMTVRIDAE